MLASRSTDFRCFCFRVAGSEDEEQATLLAVGRMARQCQVHETKETASGGRDDGRALTTC